MVTHTVEVWNGEQDLKHSAYVAPECVDMKYAVVFAIGAFSIGRNSRLSKRPGMQRDMSQGNVSRECCCKLLDVEESEPSGGVNKELNQDTTKTSSESERRYSQLSSRNFVKGKD